MKIKRGRSEDFFSPKVHRTLIFCPWRTYFSVCKVSLLIITLFTESTTVITTVQVPLLLVYLGFRYMYLVQSTCV